MERQPVKSKKHIAEQFPLIKDDAKRKPFRVSFDLSPEEGEAFARVSASYDVEPSMSQVAKMLVKRGLRSWEAERQ